MKIPKSILIKKPTKLFNNKYLYKIALVLKTAHWFRPGQFDKVLERLEDPDLVKHLYGADKKNVQPEEFCYTKEVYNILDSASHYDVRVEFPVLSLYTNDESLIESLANINPVKVKYVAIPDSSMAEGTVILKKIQFQYKVTLGKTAQSYDAFLNWCKDNPSVRVTARTKYQLQKKSSAQGGYFYVKDSKTLTVAKIFFGNCITKIETVVNQ